MIREDIRGTPVRENDLCPLWERSDLPGTAILKECWFCKWSDFREDTDEYRRVGTCCNPKRQEFEEEK